MSGFILGVNAATLDAFLAAFARLLDAFMQRHDQAARTADFHRTVARQFDAIAYRVTPARRRHALRVYVAALGRGPAVAQRVSWPRAATLALFGRSGRDRLRLVRNASRTAKTA